MKTNICHEDICFSGRVQGVGFRLQTLKIARGYEVNGSVQNLDDGRVLLKIEGSEPEIESFINAIIQEMKFFIKNVERHRYYAPADIVGFSIL